MTEAVAIALITNVTTIVIVVISRFWSHREHKQTAATVTDTNEKVTALANGKTVESCVHSE